MRDGTTRRDRVRDLFWRQGVVCSLEAFYRGELHNGRNDVGPIAREAGWRIRSVWMKKGEHGSAPKHVHYIVERRPSPQLAMAF